MAIYDFKCTSCERGIFTEMHSIAVAPMEVPCSCGATARRDFSNTNVVTVGAVKGSKLKTEMTRRNAKAGERQKGRDKPVRTVAYDYGNGDVREVKNG